MIFYSFQTLKVLNIWGDGEGARVKPACESFQSSVIFD